MGVKKVLFVMRQTVESYIIHSRGIDDISESVMKYLEMNKVSRELSIRLRLCVEEVLLSVAGRLGQEQEVELILAVSLILH